MVRLNPHPTIPRFQAAAAPLTAAAVLAVIAVLTATPAWAQSTPPSRLDDPARAADPAPSADAPIEGRVDPDTYRVGPGDEFALRYSDLLDPKILRVAPSGELLLPDAGPVAVAGLTLRETQARVREQLRPYIRGKGFMLALHRPRRFRIPVLGDVERPGSVTLQAPVRASEAIAAAGGIGPTGARRGIQVRRGSDTLRVDLVRYTRSGDLEANPLVFETDVVYVPATGRHIGDPRRGAPSRAISITFRETGRAHSLRWEAARSPRPLSTAPKWPGSGPTGAVR